MGAGIRWAERERKQKVVCFCLSYRKRSHVGLAAVQL